MITQDTGRRFRDEAGYGNSAVRAVDTITGVTVEYSGSTARRTLLCNFRPTARADRFEVPHFALHDEGLLTKIGIRVQAAGGTVTRGLQA